MQKKQPTLVLMGLRGSGKSTLGRLTASRLGLPFVDLDEVTTSLLGEGTLAELWARLGEPAFREAEARALHESLASEGADSQVIALGGGTPIAPGAANLLRDAVGRRDIVLIYLRGTPKTLRARLAATDTAERPSLTGAGTLEEIERVFAERDGLYQKLASGVIDTEGHSCEALVEKLEQVLAR